MNAVHRDGSAFDMHLVVSEIKDNKGTRLFVGKCAVEGGALSLDRKCEVVMTTTGTIESVNDGMERLFGYTRSEIVGQNVKALMPPSIAAHHDEYLSRCVTQLYGLLQRCDALRSCTPRPLAVTKERRAHLSLATVAAYSTGSTRMERYFLSSCAL